MNRVLWTILLAILSLHLSFAQKDGEILSISQFEKINPNASIQNIYIDNDNIKWIATSKDLYKITADHTIESIQCEIDNLVLLRQHGGNANLIIPKNQLRHFKAADNATSNVYSDNINTTFFDKTKKMLWLGTSQSGMYRYHINANLRLVERLNIKNSQLHSNKINSILVDKYGREWIATDGGVLYGEKKKWKAYHEGKKILLIKELNDDVWIVAENEIWLVDKTNNWQSLDVKLILSKKNIRDMVCAKNGELWIASDILSCYDRTTKESIIINQSQALSKSKITCLSFDQKNKLWIGTANNGVFTIEKKQESIVKNKTQLFQGQAISKGQIITLDKVYFEADSTALSYTSIPIIQDLYQFLKGNPTVKIEVGGHTNNIPEDSYCNQLSTQRAQSVANYLIQKGISSQRVQYRGYGKNQPIATNDSKEGRRRNQRVEIKILEVAID